MTTHRALFLDRDGVINRDDGYVRRKQDVHFIEGIFPLTAAAVARGFLPIVVTNQSGIGRGYYDERQFRRLMRWMKREFLRRRAPLAAVYFCPYHPEHGIGRYRRDSPLRKPHPGMLLRAAADFRLDLHRSILVGDAVTDMEAGIAAGVGRLFHLRRDAAAALPPACGALREVRRLADIIPALDF